MKANFNELLLLLTGLCPSVICLQETYLKPTDNLNIRGYTLYNHIHQAGDRVSGGSSIVVNNSIPQSLIPLNTNLQAVAVKVTLHRTIHVCSIYLPPGDRFNMADIEHLISQLPKPFIIMGDFNSHSNVWGCRDTDQKGRIIEDVINRNNLLLYNNKSYTYLHPGTGTYSAIDLTLADASIFLDYSWKVHDDTCGSDHFPIILENSGPELLRREDPPECTACQEIYSVRHVLIDCIDLGLIRPRFYSVPDMKTLFDTVSVDRIISFVKEINLFSKI